MTKRVCKFYVILGVLFYFFLAAPSVFAATLFLSTKSEAIGIGDKLIVEIKIESEDIGFNAAQATIQFPTQILEAVDIDRLGSVFSFWLEEPSFSNQDGKINFTGGAGAGYTGKSLGVLKVTYKVKGTGTADIVFTDGAVTASDGSGTNILSAMKGLKIVAVPKKEVTEIVSPVQIVRKAVPAEKLPDKPAPEVPLYPDPQQWYNTPSPFFANWRLPLDVTNVSAVINKNLDFASVASEGLFESKQFPLIDDGIWYLHARFKNNIGWGSTAHYKISLDTLPPAPFKIALDSSAPDDPSPIVSFDTHDALSGVAEALLVIDNQDFLRATTTKVKLPSQYPGKHTLVVKVFDKARNSVEDSLEFEILPIAKPAVTFITQTVSQNEFIFASGNTLPNTFVDVTLVDKAGRTVFSGSAASSRSGDWKLSVEKAFPLGKYIFLATARDERDARSYPTDPTSIRVRAKPMLSLGPLDLGLLEIFIFVILLVISGTGLVAWYYVSLQKTREAYRIIVGRDIDKLTTLLSGYLKEFEGLQEQHDPSRLARAAALADKMKDAIAKMKKYLGEEVERLK